MDTNNNGMPAGWGERIEDGVFVDRPLWYHTAGLQQTASGFGKRLVSSRMVRLPDGRERRVYVTCYSNAGTSWIVLDGLKRVVSDFLPFAADA